MLPLSAPNPRLFFQLLCLLMLYLLNGCDVIQDLAGHATPSPLVKASSSAMPGPTPLQTPTPMPTPGPWVSPLKTAVIMNPFGNSYPFYGSLRSGHTGVDLSVPVGTPVHAVASGIVAKVMFRPNMRYGYYIVIEHDQKPYHTLYGHLSRIQVKLKARVKAGDIIGASGKSGLASYPHVHFELLDRLPIHDGAWGYRYICKRDTSWIEMLDKKRQGKVTGMIWLVKNMGFMSVPSLELHSYLRMVKNQCREQAIAPITYFDPQPFLPKYPIAKMPDLSGRMPPATYLRHRAVPRRYAPGKTR